MENKIIQNDDTCLSWDADRKSPFLQQQIRHLIWNCEITTCCHLYFLPPLSSLSLPPPLTCPPTYALSSSEPKSCLHNMEPISLFQFRPDWGIPFQKENTRDNPAGESAGFLWPCLTTTEIRILISVQDWKGRIFLFFFSTDRLCHAGEGCGERILEIEERAQRDK